MRNTTRRKLSEHLSERATKFSKTRNLGLTLFSFAYSSIFVEHNERNKHNVSQDVAPGIR
jgi:hypothetical protein